MAVGILVLLVLSVIEVAIVSIFDPGLDTLGARLAAQALLAVTLVGVAFAVGSDRGFPGIHGPPRWTLGLARAPLAVADLRDRGAPPTSPTSCSPLVYSTLVHPHQKDITRDLGFGHGDSGRSRPAC